ncbi:MAG TPA: LysR family transcriptional regulator [Spirochaetia bacterium]|nr:LysR family transcriptional regulator [Spirochaetia bacterium]
MEWQHLEYFQTVARLQHFTRAAEELSLSQPALSRAIARLEEEMGVPLFERKGRTVSLNHYGELFLVRVNRALTEIAKGKQEIQDLLNPENGQVSLAFLHTLGNHLIPTLLGSFRRQYPQVNFRLHQDDTEAILDMLEAGEIDFGLSSPVITRKGLRWLDLLTEELLVIVPRGHRLAGRTGVELRELADELFVMLKKGYGLRAITDQLCQKAGFTPKVTFEGDEVATVAGLVAANLGVALVPEIPGLDEAGLARLPVTRPVSRRVIGMAWKEGRYLSPAAKRFLTFVTEHSGEMENRRRGREDRNDNAGVTNGA